MFLPKIGINLNVENALSTVSHIRMFSPSTFTGLYNKYVTFKSWLSKIGG